MSWGETAGVVALTAAAGGGAAFGLAAFLIWWHRISKSEGGAGYFSVLATLAGIAGGFLIGLAAALTAAPGFRAVEMRALSAVAGLTVFAGILAVVLPALRAMSRPVSGRLAGRFQVRPGGRSTPIRGNSPRRSHRKATTPSGKR
jgi:hypothetical protein